MSSFFEDCLYLTTFVEAEQALRSQELVPAYFVDDPYVSLIMRGTVANIHGSEHSARRRFESLLFRRDVVAHYELDVLVPAMDRELAHLRRQRTTVAPPKADLMVLSRTALAQVTAALIGIDGIHDQATAMHLWRLGSRTRAGAKVRFSALSEDEQQAIILDGLEAKAEFARDYFDPSMARRRELLRQGVPKNEPLDLLTLLLLHEDARWDTEQMLREAIIYLNGSTGNVSDGTAHTVSELWKWLAQHPEDIGHLEDWEFIDGAVNEAQRLHPGQPLPLRMALSDLEIGRHRIPAGRKVAIKLDVANRDPAAFRNAEQYNPHRNLQGLTAAGLAFGGGVHMCLGRPIAVGRSRGQATKDGPVGAIARLVREYFRLGVKPDSDELTVYGVQGDNIESFPVVFTKL